MSNTLAFSFEDSSITILGDILNPLFIAQQVCSILGYKLARKAVLDHCDSEDVCKVEIQTNGGKQLVNCVNESGLYALIFGSKLPKAKQFKRWVTNEVLPAIRKQGAYISDKLTYEEALKISDFNIPDVKEREVPLQNYVVQYPSFTISSSGSVPLPAIPAIPVSKHYITDNELQAIKSLIYYFDDLFKPQIQWASKEAYRQGRPDASRFYDVWHEPLWFISRMRQLVSRNS